MKAALGSSAEPAREPPDPQAPRRNGWLIARRRVLQPPGTAGAGGGSEDGGDAADAPAEGPLLETTS